MSRARAWRWHTVGRESTRSAAGAGSRIGATSRDRYRRDRWWRLGGGSEGGNHDDPDRLLRRC